MNRSKFYLSLFILCCFTSTFSARISIDNLADYIFGMVRAGSFPIKEATVWVSATHYTLVIYGHYDNNLSFNLANGIYKVPYIISWKDNLGNFANLVPNTLSPVFKGTNSNKAGLATLQMQIKGNFPKPGHYSDTLTLIITPA